jgi:ATP-binding cassette, subfamily B, multidrug efflux pump
MLAGALLSVIVGAGLTLLPPLILRRLIDSNLAQGRVEGIFLLALAYLGATVSVHLTTFITSYTSSFAAQGALRRLRVRLFGHLQKLPVSYYDHTPIGDIISRCTADMDTIDRLFSSGVISLLAELLTIVVTLGAMITLSLPLSLVLIVVLPLLIVVTRRFQVLMRAAQRELRKEVGSLISRLQEYLTRLEVIRALGWEFRVVKRFRRILARALRAQNRSIGYGAAYDPLLKIFQAAIVAGLLILGTSPVLARANVSIGTLAAFILLFEQFFGPLIRIGNEWQVVQGALAGLERIFEVLLLPTDDEAGKKVLGTISTPASNTDSDSVIVEVNDVTFGYAELRPVLNEVRLRVERGQHMAIVGRTGAGKSSLFYLLGGLYHPWTGTIRILDHDPCRITQEERRLVLGTVPQEVWLFGASIADNLTFGDKEVSRSAVERACRISGADGFISELPDEYDTILGDGDGGVGVNISMGQRQLVALARALVGDPEVLLLDEATAAVDSATESAFKHALRSHLDKRHGAVITIAHRLSTAAEADYIAVMEAGYIVEEGRPAELLHSGGHFADLWELENAGWSWRG